MFLFKKCSMTSSVKVSKTFLGKVKEWCETYSDTKLEEEKLYMYYMCICIYIYIYIIYTQHKCGILCTLNNDLWVMGVYPCALSPLLPEGGAGAHVLEGQVLMAPRVWMQENIKDFMKGKKFKVGVSWKENSKSWTDLLNENGLRHSGQGEI